jgi:hypothetical protein
VKIIKNHLIGFKNKILYILLLFVFGPINCKNIHFVLMIIGAAVSACTDVSNFRFAEFIPRFEDGEIRGGKFPSHSLLLGMECVPKACHYIYSYLSCFSLFRLRSWLAFCIKHLISRKKQNDSYLFLLPTRMLR